MAATKVVERPKEPPRPVEGRRRVVDVAEGVTLADAAMHARWAWCDPESKRSLTRIANLKRLGYRPAKAEDVVDMQDAYAEPDGTIHKGDQILMVCDRQPVEEREKAQRRERESVERRQVKAIEGGQDIETDTELHYQRVRGKEVELP